MKIVIADKISERGIALLKDTGWTVVMPAAASLPSELADADALVIRSATKATAALLEKAPKLRVIGRAGVGVDNVDMDAATRRGVLVMNTPGGNAVSVAEHTIALMLGLAPCPRRTRRSRRGSGKSPLFPAPKCAAKRSVSWVWAA
jgi:D-3-phosphoglycerate dehydrogenase